MTFFNYRAYGLDLQSEIELPELPVYLSKPAVTIHYGNFPQRLKDVTGQGILYQLNPVQCLLNLSQVAGARYLVQNGNEIIVEQGETARPEDVRLFLLCSAMGALLYQRDAFPLHGSAVKTAKGAVIFSGLSGSGKSTLAAAFCKRGYQLVADDICVISSDAQGIPHVAPGIPHLKLWADSARKVGCVTDSCPTVRPTLDKYLLPLESAFVQEPIPVAAIYMLHTTNNDEVEIEPLRGMAKLPPIQNNAYRDLFAIQMGKQSLLFQNSLKVAQRSRVTTVRRPKHRFLLDEMVDLIEKDFA